MRTLPHMRDLTQNFRTNHANFGSRLLICPLNSSLLDYIIETHCTPNTTAA